MKWSEKPALSHEVIFPQNGRDVYFQVITDTSSYVPSHWHNALEFISIISGELEVTKAGQVEVLREGDYTFINSKVIHSTKCLHGNQAILFQIPHPFIKRYIPNIDSLFFVPDKNLRNDTHKEEQAKLLEIINDMRILQEVGTISAYLQFQGRLFDFLSILYQYFSLEITHMDYLQRTKHITKLEPIIEYTEKNYTRPITLDEISGIAALQTKYFCRFFKNSMGVTYTEYLNELRLSYLYRDLISTDIPLTHLLDTHGFTNYKLFRRMFREHFHDTPSNIRKLNTKVARNI